MSDQSQVMQPGIGPDGLLRPVPGGSSLPTSMLTTKNLLGWGEGMERLIFALDQLRQTLLTVESRVTELEKREVVAREALAELDEVKRQLEAVKVGQNNLDRHYFEHLCQEHCVHDGV